MATKNGLKRGELTRLAHKAGVSPAYLYQVATGVKVPTLEASGRLYAKLGERYGPLAHPSVSIRDAKAVVRILELNGALAA
jgi:hypothetical protein